MSFDRPVQMQIVAASLVALTLLIGGGIIGATIWPRVVKVEQRVVAPAITAAAFTPAIGRLPDIVGQSCPAVVAIEQDGPPPDTSGTPPPASGRKKAAVTAASDGVHRSAGFLVSSDGYIVTSADGLSEQETVRILLNDGRSLDATRTGIDPLSGLAVLKVDGSGLPFLKFAGSSFPRVGEWAITLLTPNGTGCTLAVGTISADSLAEKESLRTFVRVSPAPDPAVAGAPVLNLDGDVIGVAGLGSAAGEPDRASSVLPAEVAGGIVSDLLRSGKPASNRFGIVADDVPPALAMRIGAGRQRGAMISLVEEGSPADKGGLKAGDLILAVSGSPISGASEVARALDTTNDTVSFDVLRRSRRLTVSLVAPNAHG